MISRQMKAYIVHENRPVIDSIGYQKDNFVPVGEVMAAVNFVSYSQLQQEQRFKDCRYSGLTAYKGFRPEKEYKLVPKEDIGLEYCIKSINQLSRLTQILLQEVRFNE